MTKKQIGVVAAVFCLVTFGLGFAAGQIVDVGEIQNSPDLSEAVDETLYHFTQQWYMPVSTEYGITLDEFQFLDLFWGPLLEELPDDDALIRAQLLDALETEFDELRPAIAERYPQLSDEELLWTFIMLRVAGSFFVYDLTNPELNPQEPPWEALLNDMHGACSNHSYRAMFAFDVFGIPSRGFMIMTPAMRGHVVLETYQADIGLAAIVDITSRAILFMRDAKAPFTETLAAMTLEERQAFVEGPDFIPVYGPYYLPYYDPDAWPDQYPPSVTELNEINSQTIKESWVTVLTTEYEQMMEKWNWEGVHLDYDTGFPPFNLSSLGVSELENALEHELPANTLRILNS